MVTSSLPPQESDPSLSLSTSLCRISLVLVTVFSPLVVSIAEARSEEWAFFAAGVDGRRHFIDIASLEVIAPVAPLNLGDRHNSDDTESTVGLPEEITAQFITNTDGSIYSMTHFCDSSQPTYGTYLLDGFSRPIQPDSIVETARTITCFSPCLGVEPGDRDWGTERMTEVATDFWSDNSCRE